jgi:glutamate synthase (NADPH/NADH) large chain
MAEMGFRTVAEMIGRVDKIDARPAVEHWKAHGIDLTRLLYAQPPGDAPALWNCDHQDHGLGGALDHEVIAAAQPAFEGKGPVVVQRAIRNVHRTAGAMLSGEIACRYDPHGLPGGSINVRLTGRGGGRWCSGRC